MLTFYTYEMRVLLTEGSGLTSRQVASRLWAAGHTVGILTSDPLCLARFTRATQAVHSVPAFGTDPHRWVDAAVEAYRGHCYDILLPTQEQVAVLSAEAERLEDEGIRTVVPPFIALAAVQDKVAAATTLDRLGLPQPLTTALSDRAAVDAFDRYPAFVKAPIGTASGGVGLVHDRVALDRLVAGWDLETAFALGGLVAQYPADGPLAMLQAVFDQGRPIAVHANLRTGEGARGGASHKRSASLPEAREVIEGLGAALGWHGALSADVIVTADGPLVIDVNPRLVEPTNAWAAGVDLVGALLDLADGRRPAAQDPGSNGIATHQLLLAVLGAAQDGRGRRGVGAELLSAAIRRDGYRDSTEELTPAVRDRDPLAAVPLVLAGTATLVRPSTWTWFSSGSVAAYALSPAGWRQILERRGDR